ncbi:MATH and LRR domain-containing protein PFE0570w-like isoform X2 [Nilaparvata lugens]|uniref:MATH and LRR domain-containing protein PFE0570w-like isoform X2 n=1 Tax=Nilaparvata lugens TaxID=108931 RepID=UPI00193CA87E|nr:MATH and LRR domain-containing protein PFE0570w-like isoform X2 [Nilaparvata lugens]
MSNSEDTNHSQRADINNQDPQMANSEERGDSRRPEPTTSSADGGAHFRGTQHSTNRAPTPVHVNASKKVSDVANIMIPQWSFNMMPLSVKPQLSPIIIDQQIADKYKVSRAAHIGILEQPRTESPRGNSSEQQLGSGNGNAPTSEMVRPPSTSTPLLRPPILVLPDVTPSAPGNFSSSPSLLQLNQQPNLNRTFQTVVNLRCPLPSNYIYPMYDHFINGVVPSYSCMFCLFRCTDQSTMEGHIRLHIDKNIPYICGLCNLGFDQLDSLEQHLNQHMYEILKCGKCDFECLPVLDMISHMLKHRNIGENDKTTQDKCRVCTGNMNVTPSSDEQIQFSCDKCGRVYPNQAQLIQHAKESHNLTDSSQICCIFCGFKTSRRRELDIHIRKHYMRKSFYCAVCEYQCAELRQMDAHIKQHTNWNMRVCKCGYKTNDALAFERHLNQLKMDSNLHEQKDMGYGSFFRRSFNDEDYDDNEEDYNDNADEENKFSNKSMRTKPLEKNMKVVEKRFYSGGDIRTMVDHSGEIEHNSGKSAKSRNSSSRNAENDVVNIESTKTANNVDKYSKNTVDSTIKNPDNGSDQTANITENTDTHTDNSSNIISNSFENTANCSSVTAESSSNTSNPTSNTKNIANSSYISDNTSNNNTKNSDIAKNSKDTAIFNEKTAESTVRILSNSGEDDNSTEKTVTTLDQKLSHPNVIVEAVEENDNDISIVYENVVKFVAITEKAIDRIVGDGNRPSNGDLGKEGNETTDDTKNKIRGTVNKVGGYEKTMNNTVVDLSITDENYPNLTMKNSYKIIDKNSYVVEIEQLGDDDEQERKKIEQNTDCIIEIEENDDCKIVEEKDFERNTNEVEIEENIKSDSHLVKKIEKPISDVDSRINKENTNLDGNIEAVISGIGIEVIISSNPEHIEKTIDEIGIDVNSDCKLGEESAVNNFDRSIVRDINNVEIEENDNTSSKMTRDNDQHVDKSMNKVLVEENGDCGDVDWTEHHDEDINKNIKDTKVEANMNDNDHVKESQKNEYDDDENSLKMEPCCNDDHVGRIFEENNGVPVVFLSEEEHADDSMKGFHEENSNVIEFGADNDCEDVEESVKNVVMSDDQENIDDFELKRNIGSEKCDEVGKNPIDVEDETDNVVEHVEPSIDKDIEASISNFDEKNTRTSSDKTMECFQNKMEDIVQDIETEADSMNYNGDKHGDRQGETFQKNMNKNVVAIESEETQRMITGREWAISSVKHSNKHTDFVTSNVELTDINNLRIMVKIDLNKLIKLGTIEAYMNRKKFSVKIPSINVEGDIVAEMRSTTSRQYSSQAKIEGGGILSVSKLADNTGEKTTKKNPDNVRLRVTSVKHAKTAQLPRKSSHKVSSTRTDNKSVQQEASLVKLPKQIGNRVVGSSTMKSGKTIVDKITNRKHLVKTLVTDFEKSATDNVVKYGKDKAKNSSSKDSLELATRNYKQSVQNVECTAGTSLISNFDKSSMKRSATGRKSQEPSSSSYTKYVSKNENLTKHGAKRSFAHKSFTEKPDQNVNSAKHGAEKKSSTYFDNTSMNGVVNTKISTILGRKRASSFENDSAMSNWKRMRYFDIKNTPVEINARRLSVDTVEQVKSRSSEISQNNNVCEGTRKKYHVGNTARNLRQRDDESDQMSSSEDSSEHLQKFSQKTAIDYIFKSAQRKAKYLAKPKIQEQEKMKANFSTDSPISWKRAKEDSSMNKKDCSFFKYEKEVGQQNSNKTSKTIEEDKVIEKLNQENGVNSTKPSPGIILQSENGEFAMEYTGETDVLIRNETTWRYEGVTKNTSSSADQARQPSIFDKMFPAEFDNSKSYAYVTCLTDSGKLITKSAGECKEAGVYDHSHDEERTALFLCALPYKTIIPNSIKIVRKQTDNNSEWIIILY